MSLGRSRPGQHPNHPGEPGVGVDLEPPFTAYDEATRWLFALNRFGIRPGLVRIEGLLEDLGHPERGLRTLVVAGTNGKGSTTRILGRLLMDAGYRVVTYTSPHLLRVHERIAIDDVPIAPEDFARRVEAIRPLTEKHEASWFETLTAIAVQVARDVEADYFCCEVGLGGRLDASNALPAVATLLTTVGLDHEAILGETLEEIAAEKMGLLKAGTPFFCGVDAELRSQAFEASVLAGCPPYFLDELTRWQDAPQKGRWDLALREQVFAGLPDLGAESMRRNTALAVLTLAELEAREEKRLLPADLPTSLGNLFLPGRYQRLLQAPDFFFDTAHNAQALRGVLAHFRRAETRGRRIVFFGSMHNKELDKLPREDLEGFDLWLGAPVSIPRSRDPEELRRLFAAWKLPEEETHVARTMPEALGWLARNLQPEDRVLVTGSCFMVAEVFHKLGFEELESTRALEAAPPRLAAWRDVAAT